MGGRHVGPDRHSDCAVSGATELTSATWDEAVSGKSVSRDVTSVPNRPTPPAPSSLLALKDVKYSNG